MELKLLGAAVTAALLGLSTASFGQGSGASGQDTAKTQSAPAASSGTATGGSAGASTGSSTGGTAGSTSGSATSGSSMGSADCDSMTGSAKARCERQHRSSRGSSTKDSTTSSGSPVTKEPAQSGPGTVDRTERNGKPGGGTSSSGG